MGKSDSESAKVNAKFQSRQGTQKCTRQTKKWMLKSIRGKNDSVTNRGLFPMLKQWDGFEYQVELTVYGVFFCRPLLQHLEGAVLLGKPLLLHVRYLVPTQG